MNIKTSYQRTELTKAQRDDILDRDNHTSQLRQYTEENGWFPSQGACGVGRDIGCQRLHVHHIEPMRNGRAVGKPVRDINKMENLITVFSCEHTGRCPDGCATKYVRRPDRKPGKWVDPDRSFVIHPDIQEALIDYDGTNNSFASVFAERNRLLKENPNAVIHNNLHDVELRETAIERTKTWAAQGKKFHTRNR